MQFKCIALCSYSIWLFNCSAKSSAHSGARIMFCYERCFLISEPPHSRTEKPLRSNFSNC